ncbi:Golgi apparatus protein 1 [Oratosquilla oratoria]|uniref:Golgi apparatus protein 1 n=1 Tax=Oratosquilla oratoria TaxID=337810 RepID=UPI003F76EF01
MKRSKFIMQWKLKFAIVIVTLSMCSPTSAEMAKTESIVRTGNKGNSKLDNDEHDDKRTSKGGAIRLIEEEACTADIQRICKPDIKNNFAILECLQNYKVNDGEDISKKCHHLVWNYKLELTQHGRIDELAKDVCEAEIRNLPGCATGTSGHFVSCVTDYLDQINDERCKQYIIRLAALVFSDYRLVEDLTINCGEEIEKFNCGRVQPLNYNAPHSQGATIECLSSHAGNLGTQCQKQILRLAEFQADDFHLDRPLYFACRHDREKFCEKIAAGEGRVYKCLLKHKRERGMSKECNDQLTRRQKLIAVDYKASKGLVKSCKTSIMQHSCRKGSSDSEQDVKLAKILLCLEGALRQGAKIEGNCQDEMLFHRRLLLEDYRLSPDLMVACEKELTDFCGDGVKKGGHTLHCLMARAKNHNTNKKLSQECWREVLTLVKESDAGEDWRVDPVLYEACHPVVHQHCKDMVGGQARVMHCLLQQIGTPDMPPTCEEALLEIQYFVARDWRLDPRIYTSCNNDAVRLCHAKKDYWLTQPQSSKLLSPKRGPLVLPCLFRYLYHPEEKFRLSQKCGDEVRRIMQERAAYVELHPEIEFYCMDSLAKFCSNNTGPGQEIMCLQQNLENLENECKTAVTNYTEGEVKDVSINAQVMQHCSHIITQLCEPETKQNLQGPGFLMDCLIRNRNSPHLKHEAKCRAVIQFFQMISLTNIRFSPKFKQDCSNDVSTHCRTSKNKVALVECLSAVVRDDILEEAKPRITLPCRQQLRLQLAQQHENIKLDPKLKSACSADIDEHCGDKQKGSGKVLECLKSKHRVLTNACYQMVFAREQEEIFDAGTDVVLLTACRQMIRLYCPGLKNEELLQCLKLNRNDFDFDHNCHSVVLRRMIEQSSDIHLNPQLHKACKADLGKFCHHLFVDVKKIDADTEGKFTECLKERLPTGKLSHLCEKEIKVITRDAVLNYKLDPILMKSCDKDMRVLCNKYTGEGSEEHMVECLKLHLEKDDILDQNCKIHVAHLIQTQRADIHVDPVLNKECALDNAKYCSEEEKGKHLACLFELLDRNLNALQVNCREILRQRREMYNTAIKVAKLETVQEIIDHVTTSPARNYLLLVFFSLVGVIFLGGLVCGRASHRYRHLKDR